MTIGEGGPPSQEDFKGKSARALFRLIEWIDRKSSESEDWKTIIYHVFPFCVSVCLTAAIALYLFSSTTVSGRPAVIIPAYGIAALMLLVAVRGSIQSLFLTSLEKIREYRHESWRKDVMNGWR